MSSFFLFAIGSYAIVKGDSMFKTKRNSNRLGCLTILLFPQILLLPIINKIFNRKN